MVDKRDGYLAFDLGAESGRAIVGMIDNGVVATQEVHRFRHSLAHLPSGMHWNLTGIWLEILEGLRQAVRWSQQAGVSLRSLGVDTWGVDFGLIGSSGELLSLPRCHRDPHHIEAYNETCAKLGDARIYAETGIQLMPINTLFQFVAIRKRQPGLLKEAQQLLFIPDLIHYFLTGKQCIEASNASTSQMIDARTGEWVSALLYDLDLPAQMLKPTVSPGTTIGPVRPTVSEMTNCDPQLPVVAPATHDTACAVAAVPADGEAEWAFLSSGTWSLMGADIDRPVISDAAREAGFTNELGVNGIRFLKNIVGMWLVQECRREFANVNRAYAYDELTSLARQAEPFRTLIDPQCQQFMLPGRMPEKIAEYARNTGQPEPVEVGAFIRCALESLALQYRRTLESLERVLDRRFDVLQVVGGGGRNDILNQMTADAIQRPVIVGPYEATGMGNVLVQAMGAGELLDPRQIRRVAAASSPTDTYRPRSDHQWQEAYERFEDICGQRES